MTEPSHQQRTSPQGHCACRSDDRPVLVVIDDEEGPRESIRMIFKNSCRVVQAASGEEGLSILRSQPADVVILDMKMPGMSGMEVLSEIRSIDPRLPVIMLTAYGTLDSATAAMHSGAIEFLSKPFDVEVIVKIVQDAIQRRRAAATP